MFKYFSGAERTQGNVPFVYQVVCSNAELSAYLCTVRDKVIVLFTCDVDLLMLQHHKRRVGGGRMNKAGYVKLEVCILAMWVQCWRKRPRSGAGIRIVGGPNGARQGHPIRLLFTRHSLSLSLSNVFFFFVTVTVVFIWCKYLQSSLHVHI